MTIDELTDRIVEWETQRSATQSSPDRRQVREELHDVDLPALDSRGAITFNVDEGMVGSSGADHDLDPHVDRDEASATGGTRSVDRVWLTVAVAAALLCVVVAAVAFGEAVAAVLTAGVVALGVLSGLAYRVASRRGVR